MLEYCTGGDAGGGGPETGPARTRAGPARARGIASLL